MYKRRWGGSVTRFQFTSTIHDESNIKIIMIFILGSPHEIFCASLPNILEYYKFPFKH